MTLTRRLAEALESLMGHLHQEVAWLEGDIHDDRFSPRTEAGMGRTQRALHEMLERIDA